MGKQGQQGRGRPRSAEAPKLAPLNMRTTPDLRQQLEEAADASGRSLTQEVERRLRTSFLFEQVRGGPHIHAIATAIGAVIQNVELDTGHMYLDDFDTFTRVRSGIDRLLEWRNPGAENSDELDTLHSEAEDKREAMEAAALRLSQFRDRHTKPGTSGRGLFGAAMKVVDRSGWSEELFREEAELVGQEDAARAMWQTANDKWRVAFDRVSKRIEAQEAKGEHVADAITEKIGPVSRGA